MFHSLWWYKIIKNKNSALYDNLMHQCFLKIREQRALYSGVSFMFMADFDFCYLFADLVDWNNEG
ncbi:Uncharacterised protein [Klebsiella michiganensis]|nr:Uncharacterised protein [Klebsiella michiganensis]